MVMVSLHFLKLGKRSDDNYKVDPIANYFSYILCSFSCSPRFTLLDAVLDEVLLGTTLKCERYKVHYFSPRRVTSPANVDKDCSFVRYHGNPDSSSQVWSSFTVKPRADIARVVFKTCTYHCLL